VKETAVKLYKVGDRSRAICSFCAQVRSITFRERDVPLSSGKGSVHDVLAGVCDHCDHVVSIPQQSVPRVKEAVVRSRHAVEARIPRQLHDALGLACHELGFGAESSSVLFRYYLRRVSATKALRSRLSVLAASEEAAGGATARFSAKLNSQMFELFKGLERSAKLNRADVVKGLIIQMKQDVLDEKLDDVRSDLQNVMQLGG
jgi:hypothetical protein